MTPAKMTNIRETHLEFWVESAPEACPTCGHSGHPGYANFCPKCGNPLRDRCVMCDHELEPKP